MIDSAKSLRCLVGQLLKSKTATALMLTSCASLSWAQLTVPPVPQARLPLINGNLVNEQPAIAVTRTPGQGELLFDFDFSDGDVMDFSRQLVVLEENDVRGRLIPSQLLFDPGQYNAVVVRLLDKITTDLETRTIPIGSATRFGTLTLEVDACLENPTSKRPESTAFLKIADDLGGTDPVERFSGWMFASSPALNALDHAIYDVWVIDCLNVVEEPQG